MKVLIIVPTHLYIYGYPSFMSLDNFPVGLAYIAAALRNAGHQVIGLNLNNDPYHQSAYAMISSKLQSSLKENPPDLICIGGLSVDYLCIRDALRIIRKALPSVPVVMGGRIVNNDMEYIFRALAPDFCVLGEGEEILVQLAQEVEHKTNRYEQIPNIGYWHEGVPRFTKQDFTYGDLDKKSFPDYEPFNIDEMINQYSLSARRLFRYPRLYPRQMTIVTARGCPFSCTFCIQRQNKGPKYRTRSIPNIMQEIDLLYEKYAFNILIISDELFAINKARMRAFCEAVLNGRKQRGWDFSWTFQTHACAGLTTEELALAREAGCYHFGYGIESSSPDVLRSMNKKTKPEQIAQAFRSAELSNVGFYGAYIFGDPAETPKTIQESIEFFSRHGRNMDIAFGTVMPYPGSQIFSDCMKKGIIQDRQYYYEHIENDNINMTSMPDGLWIEWRKQIHRLQHMPWLKSTTAIRCDKESDGNNPMLLFPPKAVWRVEAVCPHCESVVQYREPLLLPAKSVAPPRNRLKEVLGNFKDLKQPLYQLPAYILRKVLAFILYSKHPITRLADPLFSGQDTRGDSSMSFITGCVHCNKIFRIYIPQKQEASAGRTPPLTSLASEGVGGPDVG